MKLTDYPTPETVAHFHNNVWSKYDYGSKRHLEQEDIDFTKSLERRLAACREALKEILFIRQEPLPLVDLDEARLIAKRALDLSAP